MKKDELFVSVEDHSTLLFKANGSALTVSAVAISNIIPTQTFTFPIWPCVMFFMGLLLAFGVHSIATIESGDQRTRQQRRTAAAKLDELAKQIEAADDAVRAAFRQAEAATAEADKRLLTPSSTARLGVASAYFYFGSLLCFAIGVASALTVLATAGS